MTERKTPKELARKWKRKMIWIRWSQASGDALTSAQEAALRELLVRFLQGETNVRETTEASQ